MQNQRAEIRSLTGLRGLAASLVVFYHFSFNGVQYPAWILPLFAKGYLSVDLFFVLSGYVMGLSYTKLFETTPTVTAFCTFVLRRIARVYPLYLLVTLVTAEQDVRHALQNHTSIAGYGWTFAGNLIFLQGLGLCDRVVGQAWSVATEFVVYLVFPMLLAASIGRVRPVLCAAVSVVTLLLLTYPPLGIRATGLRGPLDVSAMHSVLPAVRCVAEFMLGLCLFRYAMVFKNLFSGDVLSIGIGAATLISLCIDQGDLPFVLFATLLIGSLPNNTLMARGLGSRPIFVLGELSYAIYLWHMILFVAHYAVLIRLERHFGNATAEIGAMIAYWGILLAVSYATFRFVEVPGRRFVRGIERKLFPAEDAKLRVEEVNAVRQISPG